MFKKIVVALLIFFLTIGLSFSTPSQKDVHAGDGNLFVSGLNLVIDIIQFFCPVFRAVDAIADVVDVIIPFVDLDLPLDDFCDFLDELEDVLEASSRKYPQPKVTIQFQEGYVTADIEEDAFVVNAIASPSNFKLDSGGVDSLYFTWAINGDYKYNAYYAGGDITNRWGTLVKDGDTYRRSGGEGYNAWKEYYGVGSGGEDNDDDGFNAPYGGPNGDGKQCAQMLRDDGDTEEIDCGSDLVHEFSKLVVSCPDGSSGVIGDGVYSACEEFTWGTDPTASSTKGDDTLNDEMMMAGVGAINFTYKQSDLADMNVEVTVVVEGTTIIKTDDTDSTHYIMKAQNTRKAYDDNDYLNIDIKIIAKDGSNRPQAGEDFTAQITFSDDNVQDRDTLEYRWRFWRKDADLNAAGSDNFQSAFGMNQITLPGDSGATTEGIYFVEAQVCNKVNDVPSCGRQKKEQVLIGGQSLITLEGLVGDTDFSGTFGGTQFEPIETVLRGDIIKATAECYMNPELNDPSLGCDANGYNYVWDIYVGTKEKGKSLTRVYDGNLEFGRDSDLVNIDLINGPSIIFEVPYDTTNFTIEVNGIGVEDQDVKIDSLPITLLSPTIDVVVESGGSMNVGSTEVGKVNAGGTATLSAIPGPAGSTFERKAQRRELMDYWSDGRNEGYGESYSLTASSKIGTNHQISVYAWSPVNEKHLSETKSIVLKVSENGNVQGKSIWRNGPKIIYQTFTKEGPFNYSYLFSFIIVALGFGIIGKSLGKKNDFVSAKSKIKKLKKDDFDM